MAYFMVTGKTLQKAFDDWSNQYKAQNKQALKIKRKLKAGGIWISPRGLHAVEFKDRKSVDKTLWMHLKRYDLRAFRPKKISKAKHLQEMFDSVPKIDEEPLKKALNIGDRDIMLQDGRFLRFPGIRVVAGEAGEEGCLYVFHIDDKFMPMYTPPKGSREITFKRYTQLLAEYGKEIKRGHIV